MARSGSAGKGLRIYLPLLIIVLFIAVAIWFWYRDYARYISTDDAHINCDNVQVSSKILGRIARLHAQEGDTIRERTLLVELDSLDLLAQKNQTGASLLQATAQLEQAKAKLAYDNENIKVYQIAFEKAKDDYERGKLLKTGDVITREQYEHLQKAFEAAGAQLDAAKIQLTVSRAQIESANAAVGFAKAHINVIETEIADTKLYAPFDGIVAKRWLLAGDIVQPGQAVYSLTARSLRWVIVYLEETKISHIHLNQPAKFTVDAFGDRWFRGRIFSIGASTASLFSLIPANNASGNFTKVTQRVPVKISIDSDENGMDVKNLSFLPGMSVVVKILKEE